MLTDEHSIEPAGTSNCFARSLFAIHQRQQTGVLTLRASEGQARFLFVRGKPMARVPEDVRSQLLEFFRLDSLHHAFLEDPTPLIIAANWQAIDLRPLIFTAIRRYYGPDRTARIFEPLQRLFPRLLATSGEVAERFGMKPGEQRFLELLDGTNRVDALFANSSLDSVHAAQVLHAVVVTEAAVLSRFRSISTHAKGLQHVNHVRVPVGPVPAVAAAKPAPALKPEHRAKLAAALTPNLPALDPDAAQNQARIYFQNGKRSLDAAQYGKALSEFRYACEFVPQSLEYRLYAAWAEYRAANDVAERAAQAEALEKLALGALQKHRDMAFAYYVYGHLRLAAGDETRALRAFKSAMHLDARLADAKRHYQLLERRLKRGA